MGELFWSFLGQIIPFWLGGSVMVKNGVSLLPISILSFLVVHIYHLSMLHFTSIYCNSTFMFELIPFKSTLRLITEC